MIKKFSNYLVPFYKEKNIDTKEVLKWFKVYNKFVTKYDTRQNNYVASNAFLDQYSSGVCFISSGSFSDYGKYFQYLTSKTRLVGELGYETRDGWFFNEKLRENKFDHVNENNFKNILKEFSDKQIALLTRLDNFEKKRVSNIKSIELINFQSPYFCLDIEGENTISYSGLIYEISSNLNTVASIIDIDRYSVCDIKKEDCLTKTDIYDVYINEKSKQYKQKINDLLKGFIHKEEVYTPTYSRRLVYS